MCSHGSETGCGSCDDLRSGTSSHSGDNQMAVHLDRCEGDVKTGTNQVSVTNVIRQLALYFDS